LLGVGNVKNIDGSWMQLGNLVGAPIEKGEGVTGVLPNVECQGGVHMDIAEIQALRSFLLHVSIGDWYERVKPEWVVAIDYDDSEGLRWKGRVRPQEVT